MNGLGTGKIEAAAAHFRLGRHIVQFGQSQLGAVNDGQRLAGLDTVAQGLVDLHGNARYTRDHMHDAIFVEHNLAWQTHLISQASRAGGTHRNAETFPLLRGQTQAFCFDSIVSILVPIAVFFRRANSLDGFCQVSRQCPQS